MYNISTIFQTFPLFSTYLESYREYRPFKFRRFGSVNHQNSLIAIRNTMSAIKAELKRNSKAPHLVSRKPPPSLRYPAAPLHFSREQSNCTARLVPRPSKSPFPPSTAFRTCSIKARKLGSYPSISYLHG